MICSTEKNIRTQRRSILLVAEVISSPVTSATSAVAVTACPAIPSLTPGSPPSASVNWRVKTLP
jgi:hypothetical protein